ncbi:MAG TPA: hypothetical protein VN624_11070 [Rhodanobacter sp.]|nr:hypothetical protein [Rhodanobacter sp.]
MSEIAVRVNPVVGARNGFFFAAHCALLAVVFVGFGRTFYLRAFFDTGPLPAQLYVHGAILTLWFSFAVVQAWLVRSRQLRRHRRVGYAAATYAAAVVVSGMVVNSHLAATLASPADAENIIVWGNYLTLLMFALFVGLGVLLRKRAEAHKRLMLLASVAIVGPALGRFPLWPIFAGGLDAARNYAIGGLLLLLASLIVYDIATRRRPHPATWLGAIAIFVGLAVSVALGVTGIGFVILQRLFHGA